MLFQVLLSMSVFAFPVQLSPCNLTTCVGSVCATASTDCGVTRGCICVGGYVNGTVIPSTTCCCTDWAGHTSNCRTTTGQNSSSFSGEGETESVILDATQPLTLQVGGSGANLSLVANKFAAATGVQLSLWGSAGSRHVAPGRYEGTLSQVFESLARGVGARATVSAATKSVKID